MSSEDLSRIIMSIETYADKTFSIVCIVLTYICAIVYFYAFAKIMSITLLFRPTSMLTTSLVCVFGIIDHKASLTAIFVFVMIVSFPIIDFYEKKCLKKLDEFAPSF
ncbi:hypothetical protein M9Y10_020605 [Tritrichomonas musculus]|uniref:Uncharacterized protein n=1 Tax=Tritrichomonas musculus TaxID=1915356 RepID=A0ABR2HGD3_9EUKA